MSVPAFVGQFIETLGLNAIKDVLSETHDTMEINNSIKEFAEREFKHNFSNLPLESEFDYISKDTIERLRYEDESKN